MSSKIEPLPSNLPSDLKYSIVKVLSQRQAGSQKSATNGNGVEDNSSATEPTSSPPREPPSLTAQITELFPSTDSVTPAHVERRQAEIRHELAEQERCIEALLAALVRRQQEQAQDGTEAAALQKAPVEARVEALLKQLATIREKARKSEEVVRDITREIRNLDTCKRNVVASMTALKRLQMLVNAVAQLERLTRASRFREAASALSAVKSLQSSFKGFAGVERVASIQREVFDLQRELSEKATSVFENQ